MKTLLCIVQFVSAIMTTMLLSSCASGTGSPMTATDEAASSPRFIQRAEEFRQAVAVCPEIGIGLSEKTIAENQREPGRLAARISLLGVTEVYCRINPEMIGGMFARYPDQLRLLLANMHRYRIRCYAEIDGTELFAMVKRGGDQSVRNQIREMVRNIYAFNRDGKADQQFDGLITILLPHRADDMFARRHPSTIYHWTSKGYGIDNENDQMHREARSWMMDVKTTAMNMEVGQHTSHFYHDRTVNGELSSGSVNNYLDVAAFVMIEDHADTRQEMRDNVIVEIRDARRPRSMMMNLITGGDSYSERARQESLQSKSWTDISAAIYSVTRELKKYPAFRGIAFSDYGSLEAIIAPGQ